LLLLFRCYYCFSYEISYDTNKVNALVVSAQNLDFAVARYGIDMLNRHSEKIVCSDIWISLNFSRNAEKLASLYNYKSGKAYAILNQAMALSIAGDYEESIDFSDSAYSLYSSLNDSAGMIRSLFWKSISYCFCDITEAQNTINTVFQYPSLKNNYELYGDIISVQSFIYLLSGEYEQSMKCLDASTAIASAFNNSSRLAQCYHKRSLIYSKKGKYELSLSYSLKALKIYIDRCEYVNVVKILNKIINILLEQDDLYNARRVFNLEYIVLKKINLQRSWSTYYFYLSQFYSLQNNYPKAISYLNLTYNIQKNLNDTLNFSLTLRDMASTYLETDSLDAALSLYKKVLGIQDKIGFNYGTASTLSSMGTVYYKQGKYQEAVNVLERSDSFLRNVVDNKLMIENYSELSKAYFQLKNYPEAYSYLEQCKNQQDSLYQQTVSKQISDLMVRYESGEKDYKIKKLSDAQEIIELKSKRERLYTFILVILLFMLTALFIMIYITIRQRQKNKFQSLLNESQRKTANAILEAQDKERNNIGRDLHDGIGAMIAAAKLNLSCNLNETGEKLRTNISSAVSELDTVIKEIREVARNLMTDTIAAAGITQALQNHTEKMNQAQKDIHFKLISFGDFSGMENNALIALYKISLELIHNCIKYSKATEATIEITELENAFIFTMEDNGVGFDVEACMNKGLGLKNINYRVALLGGKCQFDSHVGSGSTISIEIPKEL
jgi:two-component system, NarL family, sensor kinase